MLEIVVFLTGAIVMILEIVGSRILAPSVGTSVYVWTSLISVILGSLSLGYFLGGKFADKEASFTRLSQILLSAAVAILLIVFIKTPLFFFLQKHITDVRLLAILATALLFALPSILLGMVSPYAVKLKMKSMKDSASIVGNLYALATMGSIAGTIAAGFYLIAAMGSIHIILLLSGITFALSVVTALTSLRLLKGVFLLLFCAVIYHTQTSTLTVGRAQIESSYNTINVYDTYYRKKAITALMMGRIFHSARYIYSNELVFDYTKYYHLASHFNPEMKNALMIGGGGYSFPTDYLAKYPANTIDVVEIDPVVTSIARQHFALKNSPRMRIIHQDGRVFLNNTPTTYDAILLDAFGHDYIPFHLATQEAVARMYQTLTANGIVITNIVSSLSGEKSRILHSQYKTFQSVFPYVYIFPVNFTHDKFAQQNIILIAAKKDMSLRFSSNDKQILEMLGHRADPSHYVPPEHILTDDHAPLEYYSLSLML